MIFKKDDPKSVEEMEQMNQNIQSLHNKIDSLTDLMQTMRQEFHNREQFMLLELQQLRQMVLMGAQQAIPSTLSKGMSTYVETQNPVRERNAPRDKQPQYQVSGAIAQRIAQLGIPSHIKGFAYINTAIQLYQEDPSLTMRQISVLLAPRYKTTPSRIERAIRHAIEVGCNRGHFRELFDGRQPSNDEFIRVLSRTS
ncbi:sporulation initiation factor Spo0A C-terminal domain-containing protein [Paenibacillus sp. PR3]|uniref:Sporulation initiation factor Spo0A C-terminal domain-containing protein n=1 Tax=Paenibacillus terricola TaxID=2763503 RepID=A0ABR8MUK5_9BACL|nr:sporulation initiation factor Spo0A C-terminal domain-containing protein [Paenibacillus terricola]MBD3919647.1 sporulation initiation factor Spo0A C-terminal domain-containing protein [Paenibacillus terricola]